MIVNTLLLKVKQNCVFVILALLFLSLFAFHLWMAYPGFIMPDSQEFLLLYKNNWHPVCISYIVQALFFLFGRHVCLLLLLNLVPFYLGMFLLSWGFYKKNHSNCVWLTVAISLLFVASHFFDNFYLISTSIHTAFLILLWSMAFYIWQNPISKKSHKILFWTCFAVVFILTLVSRQNGLLGVLPLGCFFAFSQKKNALSKVFYIMAFTFICYICGIVFPSLIAQEKSYPANHILLHQIAGACVPSNDSSCFPEEWYEPGKTWQDAKEIYLRYPLDADRIGTRWYEIKAFDGFLKKDKIIQYWLNAIRKHPRDYIKHLYSFWHAYQNTAALKPGSKYITQQYAKERDKYDQLLRFFDPDELHLNFSETQDRIYNSLRKQLPRIRTRYCVWTLCIIFIFSLVMLFKKKKQILFTFFASAAGLFVMLCIACFSPIVTYRYTLPASVLCLVAIVSCFSFLKENNQIKTLGKIVFRLFSIIFLIFFCGALFLPKNLDMHYLARNNKPLWQFWVSDFLGHPVNQKDPSNRNVLSFAAEFVSDPDVITFVLKKTHRKDINLMDTKWHATPLQFALDHNENEKVIETLIDAGADVNTNNQEGKSILLQAVSKPLSDNLIKKILQLGADVYATDQRNKANVLHWAAEYNNSLDVIKMLIGYGIDVNEPDSVNRTALMKAARHGENPQIIKYLLDQGAILDKQDRSGMTALMIGCRDSQNPDVLLSLLQAGADVSIKDRYDRDALFYAKLNPSLKNTLFIQILEKVRNEREKK